MYIVHDGGFDSKVSKCQFLIGNVYPEDMLIDLNNNGCQFLIGNVYQLVLSVSNYDTTPFSDKVHIMV